MRSYRDCLIEYLEEVGYNELNTSWYSHVVSSIEGISSSNFQLLEELPPIESDLDFNFYGDVLPDGYLVSRFGAFSVEKRSANYKALIRKLIEGEYTNLKTELKQQQLNWKICKSVLNYPREKNYMSYSKSLVKCLKKSNVSKGFIDTYLKKEESSELNFFTVIEDFFDADHYHLNAPNYEPRLSSVVNRTIAINFDSHSTNRHSEKSWSCKTVNKSSNFFIGKNEQFDELNAKAKLSQVKVKGTLNNLNKTQLSTGGWFNTSLIDLLFNENQNKVKDRLDYHFIKKVKNKFCKCYDSFYSIDEFDLTVEVVNSFTQEEIDLLRSVQFSLFPFHFSNKHEQFKWIDTNEEGNLIIRIKSKHAQPTIIGADLKAYRA